MLGLEVNREVVVLAVPPASTRICTESTLKVTIPLGEEDLAQVMLAPKSLSFTAAAVQLAAQRVEGPPNIRVTSEVLLKDWGCVVPTRLPPASMSWTVMVLSVAPELAVTWPGVISGI